MEKLKVGIVSLGCDKNRIDSEIVIGNIYREHEIVSDPRKADVIIVNTCGFIETSKQESIDTILEMAKYKEKYNCKVLVVTGCLTQRYGKELMELMPEIDILLGVNDYDKLNSSISKFIFDRNKVFHLNYSDSNINSGNRVLTSAQHTAYLRIAEGCNNFCTYCIIPKIRGRFRSRKMEDILAEAETLSKSGVKEIILVAQDTTKYGTDIYDKKMLPDLLRKLSNIDGIHWVRVLYCYPEEITDELIEEITVNPKVCKYIDMPLQHISNDILKSMRRRGTKEQITDNIKKMRQRIPGISLRTSIIVGFPGETDVHFLELKQFIEEMKFDKLGVFRYSQEEGTVAAQMENQVDEEVKIQREETLMLTQQQISSFLNESKVGNVYEVIVDGQNGDFWSGRNSQMAPEIDGTIFFKCDKMLSKGDFVLVKISKSLEYDLIGDAYYESCK